VLSHLESVFDISGGDGAGGSEGIVFIEENGGGQACA
jgi:hypothetical protein